MAREIERRTFTRDAAPKLDDSGKMHGKAAPFNSPTMIGNPKRGGFREKIHPGAFDKTVSDGDIVLLDNHNTAHPIARMSAGTLRVEKRDDGAYWDADPVDTTYSRDAQKNIDAGNYGGCSFGFEVIKDAWTRGADGVDERELLEVRCHEISTVTFPAYVDTNVSMRSAVDAARESAPDEFRTAEEEPDPEEREFPDLTDLAAQLITAYNLLPEDLRAEQPENIRSAIAALEVAPEPGTPTQETEAREDTALEDAAILAIASQRAAELTE